MPLSARHAEKRSVSSSLIFSRSRSVTPQPWIFELELSNSIIPAERPIGLTRLVYRLRPSWLRWRFAPPVQGHDTHTQRARNFALRFPLRRQIICLCQLRRDFDPRVPFLLSHSSLYSTSHIQSLRPAFEFRLVEKMVNSFRLGWMHGPLMRQRIFYLGDL